MAETITFHLPSKKTPIMRTKDGTAFRIGETHGLPELDSQGNVTSLRCTLVWVPPEQADAEQDEEE